MAQPILSFFSPGLVYCFDLGKYKSLRWRPMYDKPGEFEMHTSPTLFSQVESGQLILRPDRPKETVKVEGIAIEDYISIRLTETMYLLRLPAMDRTIIIQSLVQLKTDLLRYISIAITILQSGMMFFLMLYL